MGNPTFLQQKSKKPGQLFQIEKPLVGMEEGFINLIFFIRGSLTIWFSGAGGAVLSNR